MQPPESVEPPGPRLRIVTRTSDVQNCRHTCARNGLAGPTVPEGTDCCRRSCITGGRTNLLPVIPTLDVQLADPQWPNSTWRHPVDAVSNPLNFQRRSTWSNFSSFCLWCNPNRDGETKRSSLASTRTSPRSAALGHRCLSVRHLTERERNAAVLDFRFPRNLVLEFVTS